MDGGGECEGDNGKSVWLESGEVVVWIEEEELAPSKTDVE